MADLIDPDNYIDLTEDDQAGVPLDDDGLMDLLLALIDVANNKLQRTGGGSSQTGDLDMAGNDILDVRDLLGADSSGDTQWRIRFDGNNNEWKLQQNTGTQDNPTWTTRFTFGLKAGGELQVRGNEVMHKGNDGAGSEFNADLLDGYEAATLLGDAAGTIINWKQTIFDPGQVSDGDTNFNINPFDPKDQRELVIYGGQRLFRGNDRDYTRNDPEAEVTGNSTGANNQTYTIRKPELEHDTNEYPDQTVIYVVEDISDASTEDGSIEIKDTNNTLQIQGIDGAKNAFIVNGDVTDDPSDTEIILNFDAAGNTRIVIEKPTFASEGDSDADTVDQYHAFELIDQGQVNFQNPKALHEGTNWKDQTNFTQTVDVTNDVPNTADRIVLKVWTKIEDNDSGLFVEDSDFIVLPIKNDSQSTLTVNIERETAGRIGALAGDDSVHVMAYNPDESPSGIPNPYTALLINADQTLGESIHETKVWAVGYIHLSNVEANVGDTLQAIDTFGLTQRAEINYVSIPNTDIHPGGFIEVDADETLRIYEVGVAKWADDLTTNQDAQAPPAGLKVEAYDHENDVELLSDNSVGQNARRNTGTPLLKVDGPRRVVFQLHNDGTGDTEVASGYLVYLVR